MGIKLMQPISVGTGFLALTLVVAIASLGGVLTACSNPHSALSTVTVDNFEQVEVTDGS
jgi:hypothetical protein